MSEAVLPADVSISLTVKDGRVALAFYAAAFGAVETLRMETPDGGIGHAEFRIGSTKIYLSEEYPPYEAYAMPTGGRSSCLFSIQLSDCDSATTQAVAAGAEVIQQPKDEPWGSRGSVVLDPFGYRWCLFHVLEELTPEEMIERMKSAT